MLTLNQLFHIRRDGCLPDPVFRDSLYELAGDVRQIGEQVWHAPSTPSAAAWLLCAIAASYEVDGNPSGTIPKWDASLMLGFRGQFARFERLVPSYCRLKPADREHYERALQWYIAAVNLIVVRDYRYFVRSIPKLHLDFSDAAMIAQHYEMPTVFVDWTWDPLVAMVFGAYALPVGEQASVIISVHEPGTHMNFML